MLERARRAMPGMMVSMLLALPLLATISCEAAASEIWPEGGIGVSASSIPPASGKARSARRSAAVSRKVHARATGGFVRAQTDTVTWNSSAGDEKGLSGGWHQEGIASWYGGQRWRGNRTSSGSTYDENALTAAHASLPMGSRVKVTLIGSDRSVIVTITDRPGTRTRVIDLSRQAADQLGILERGVATVMLTAL